MFGANAFGWIYPAQAFLGLEEEAGALVAAGRFAFVTGTAELVAPAATIEARGKVQQRATGRGRVISAAARFEALGSMDLDALEEAEILVAELGVTGEGG